jgi:tetratricopeptide (TPR) repeat protein
MSKADMTASRLAKFLAIEAIFFAVLAAYSNGFTAPFVFDDEPSILGNPSIRSLWPLWGPLLPPGDMTVSGRPLVNLTLAVNYAFGKLDVRGYHAVNVLIHALAALALFGIVRRTLEKGAAGAAAAADAAPLALAAALLWAVHPLQTEAVMYTVQRAEALMGLFFLLALYGFIRGEGAAPANARWRGVSIAACWLGMASKEVMAAAPLVVLLYDRTFAAGSFREAWRLRRAYYLWLGASWVLLGLLVLSTGGRSGTVGPGVGIGWWDYLKTQVEAVERYLALAVWPHPLVFEYGPSPVPGAREIWPGLLAVAALGAGAACAVFRKSSRGFLAAWFLAILAPTALVPGVRQMIAEHRMYLALAPLCAAAVVGAHALAGRRSWVLWPAAAALLGILTLRRNAVYASPLSLWADTVAHRPGNPYAINNYGSALSQAGRAAEAEAQLRTALGLKPDYADARANLGNALMQEGRVAEAIPEYREALRLDPVRSARGHNNLGVALYQSGDAAGAQAEFDDALRRDPAYAEARNNLGNTLLEAGRAEEAAAQLREALRLRPDYPDACNNLGRALLALGRRDEARALFERALLLQPGFGAAVRNLAELNGRSPTGPPPP